MLVLITIHVHVHLCIFYYLLFTYLIIYLPFFKNFIYFLIFFLQLYIIVIFIPFTLFSFYHYIFKAIQVIYRFLFHISHMPLSFKFQPATSMHSGAPHSLKWHKYFSAKTALTVCSYCTSFACFYVTVSLLRKLLAAAPRIV